jgi:hypothetical protein
MLANETDPIDLAELQTYVMQLLGARIDIKPFAKANSLPAFLRDRYSLFAARLLNHRCILMIAAEGIDETPGAIAKHRALLQRDYPDHLIILIANRISTHNRQRLIAQHVPFIVPGNQMFVPDLAIDLREHFRKQREAPADKLGPTAQLLVLAALQGELAVWTPTGLAERFDYSTMTMSRAIDELEAFDLATAQVQGKFRHFQFRVTGERLWDAAHPLLRSPVRKRHIVRHSVELERLPLAGESALAHWTDLGGPAVEVRAVAAASWPKLAKAHGLDVPPDWNEPQVEVETWSYDPLELGEAQVVDPLSLWLSLPERGDDRFAMARDSLLQKGGL